MNLKHESSQTMDAKPMLRTLLAQIIDYAGLFPPAKLKMEPTVANYKRYLEGEQSWMLSRLIVPVARLDEFELVARAHLPNDPDATPWRISAITAPAGSDELLADLERIAAFNHEHQDARRGLALIETIELKADSPAAIESACEAIPDNLLPYFELPLEPDPRGLITALSGAGVFAKARTGGMTPELFPSPEALARFIAACCSAGVAFKATAGLHHPFRHDSHTVAGVKEFGFFNVFLSAAFAFNELIDEAGLIELLEDEDAQHFEVRDDTIAWRGEELTAEEVADARTHFAHTYGSCSFEEPIDDLRDLGLL